jgi:alkanesulfonate monooxygenase SsuD/methylene tetrahydromethanopterin reductase-like flavin-dependent oxidoreductase (luciferase family)
MRIGIGLPAAVPGVDGTTIGAWAAEAERAGFASVGVIDRLVYDNLEPLTVLAAAAARTEHVELFTTVLNVGWRANPVLLAKQMASVDLLSGGRLTAGLGLGGWPEDFAASHVPTSGTGARLRDTLATMRRVWAGDLSGQGGPMPRLPEGRPGLLFGGLVPAAHKRAAAEAQAGWRRSWASKSSRTAWPRCAKPGPTRDGPARRASPPAATSAWARMPTSSPTTTSATITATRGSRWLVRTR